MYRSPEAVARCWRNLLVPTEPTIGGLNICDHSGGPWLAQELSVAESSKPPVLPLASAGQAETIRRPRMPPSATSSGQHHRQWCHRRQKDWMAREHEWTII